MNPDLRLLLVEDDVIYLERLAGALAKRGYPVATAETADQAILVSETFQPSAAVLDLNLPGKSGLECLRELKARWPDLRVIMVTGYGSIATAMEAVRLGAWDYLTKPVDVEHILQALAAGPRPAKSANISEPLRPPSLERLEWEHIQRVLADCRGNISHAAEVLGLHRRSLQRKLRKFPPSH